MDGLIGVFRARIRPPASQPRLMSMPTLGGSTKH